MDHNDLETREIGMDARTMKAMEAYSVRMWLTLANALVATLAGSSILSSTDALMNASHAEYFATVGLAAVAVGMMTEATRSLWKSKGAYMGISKSPAGRMLLAIDEYARYVEKFGPKWFDEDKGLRAEYQAGVLADLSMHVESMDDEDMVRQAITDSATKYGLSGEGLVGVYQMCLGEE